VSMRTRARRHSGGFTLVEMLTVVAVIGLILTMLSLEFISVVSTTLHTRANTDAESQARTIMAKVDAHLRAAYFDYPDFPPGASPVPVISPVPAASATPLGYVTFYRVRANQLATTPPTCGPNQPYVQGAPCPLFDQVTIELNPRVPGELDEIVQPASGGGTTATTVLGTGVTNFSVTPMGGGSPNGYLYQVQLTVSKPSAHCVANQCSFTLSDLIYVGGQQ
jgi:prepilin-type N-terminal cleavage/methylation domain-containing protein